jgi:lambda family phage portal protein
MGTALATKPRIRVRADGTFPQMEAFLGFGNGGRAYDAGRHDSREMAGWHTGISTSNDEILQTRDEIVARGRDLVRNNPTISGAVDRLTESIIGAKLWLECQPDFEAMGKTSEWADKWATTTEASWRVYASDPFKRCDVDRKVTLPHMFRAAYRHWLVDGEACAVVKMAQRGGKYRTCFKLIDPDRLSNPMGKRDEQILDNGNTIIGGVEIDPAGEAVAYHVRKKHPNSATVAADKFTWERIPRFSGTGRPIFIHAFRYDRADQRRGISRLAASMARVKMSDRNDKAELEANLLRALNTLFIKSSRGSASVAEALAPADDGKEMDYISSLLDFRSKNKVAIDGVNVTHLFPDEAVDMPNRGDANANYPAFQQTHDRKIAASLGMSYPHMSNNWADINYSSGRLMRNEMWRGFIEDRELFTQEFCTMFFAAWCEEAVAVLDVKVPGGPANYYRWKSELCQVEWMGPGPGTGDPKKEAEANELELRQNVTTLATIAAERGQDSRKIIQSRAREKRMLAEAGLIDITDVKSTMGAGRPANDVAADPGSGADPVGSNA